MNSVEKRRRDTLQAIKISPASITIARATTEPDGAGGSRKTGQTTTLPQVVRIVISQRSAKRKGTAPEIGDMQYQLVELLAPWDADLQRSDRFMYGNERYIIQQITPVTYFGHIVSLQCEIEKVS